MQCWKALLHCDRLALFHLCECSVHDVLVVSSFDLVLEQSLDEEVTWLKSASASGWYKEDNDESVRELDPCSELH